MVCSGWDRRVNCKLHSSAKLNGKFAIRPLNGEAAACAGPLPEGTSSIPMVTRQSLQEARPALCTPGSNPKLRKKLATSPAKIRGIK